MSDARRVAFALLVAVGLGFSCGGPSAGRQSRQSTAPLGTGNSTSADVRTGLSADFRVIPADSPYVFVSLDPRAGLIPGLVRFALPLLKTAIKEQWADADTDTQRRLRIFSELIGPGGLEKIGIDSTPNFAIYGIRSAFVARIELSDGVALEAYIKKTENENGGSIVFNAEGKWRTWQSQIEGKAFLVAIRETELVFSVMNLSDKDKVLPMLVGEVLPKRSIVDTGILKELSARYPGQSIGYLDNEQLFLRLADGAFDTPIAEMSKICLQETRSFFGIVPRVVMSIEKPGQDEFTYHMGVELRKDIARQFRKTVGPIPAYRVVTQDKSSMSLGLGLKIDKVITWWRKIAHDLGQSPYQCKDFEELNEISASAGPLNLISSLVGEITGVVISIVEMKSAENMESIVAIAAVESWNPRALMEFILGVIPVPGFSSQSIQDDGVAVELPLAGMGIPQGMYLAMGPRMLGVGVGESGWILSELVTAEVATGGAFFAMHYDYSKWQHLVDVDEDEDMSPAMRATVNSFLASLRPISFSLDATKFGVHMMTSFELK